MTFSAGSQFREFESSRKLDLPGGFHGRGRHLDVRLLCGCFGVLFRPLSLLELKRRFEFVFAATRARDVGAAAELASRFAIFGMVFSGIISPASKAHPCVRSRAHISPVPDLATCSADLSVLPIQCALSDEATVLYIARDFVSFKQYYHRLRVSEPVSGHDGGVMLVH